MIILAESAPGIKPLSALGSIDTALPHIAFRCEMLEDVVETAFRISQQIVGEPQFNHELWKTYRQGYLLALELTMYFQQEMAALAGEQDWGEPEGLADNAQAYFSTNAPLIGVAPDICSFSTPEAQA